MDFYRRTTKLVMASSCNLINRIPRAFRRLSQVSGDALTPSALNSCCRFSRIQYSDVGSSRFAQYVSMLRRATHTGGNSWHTASALSSYRGFRLRHGTSLPQHPSQPYDKSFFPWFALIASIVLPSLYYTQLETVPYTKRTRLVALSPAMEKRLGKIAIKRAKKKFKDDILPKEHDQCVRVNSIAKSVIEALVRGINQENVWSGTRNCNWEREYIRGMNWEIVVVDKPTKNAGCFLGPNIVFFTGLLEHTKTDDELAYVIAHEIGHAVARHKAEGLPLVAGSLILYPILTNLSLLPESVSNFVYKYFAKLPLRRKHEREADYIGLHLMASAGYDPRVAPKLHLKMSSFELPFEDYYSSHPSDKKKRSWCLRIMSWRKHCLCTTKPEQGTTSV